MTTPVIELTLLKYFKILIDYTMILKSFKILRNLIWLHPQDKILMSSLHMIKILNYSSNRRFLRDKLMTKKIYLNLIISGPLNYYNLEKRNEVLFFGWNRYKLRKELLRKLLFMGDWNIKIIQYWANYNNEVWNYQPSDASFA